MDLFHMEIKVFQLYMFPFLGLLLLLKQIKTLHYGIQHARNNLAAEKKLLRDIKQAEAERDKITVDVSTKPNILGYWELKNAAGSKEAMKDRLKVR